MICPICGTDLRRYRKHGIDLDQCTSCHGVWFDPGELEAYRSAAGAEGRAKTAAGFETLRGAGKVCPLCTTPTLIEGRSAEVKLFRCERCRGVYLPKQSIPEEAGDGITALDVASEGALWFSEGIWEFVADLFDGF